VSAKPPFTDADLNAWVDGRLDADGRAAVDAWLTAHPERARELEDWRKINDRLRTAYEARLHEAVPTHLKTSLPRRRHSLQVAAIVGWLALGGLIGAAGGYRYGSREAPAPAQPSATRSAAAPMDLARRAAIAHAVYSPEQRHPVEVGADQEAHLVAWLSKRLGTPLRVPQLDAQGYHLVGGRLLATDAGPGAQFMYEDVTGERLTLYVSARQAADTGTGFRFAEEQGIAVFYWVDRGFAYALSGKATREVLLPTAEAVYRQLAP